MLLAAPAAAAQRDAFTDKSGRFGPEFVDIAPGDYVLGSGPEETGYKPLDRRRLATLQAFALTTREITNDEFVDFLNEKGELDPLKLPWVPRRENVVFLKKGKKLVVRTGMGKKPVVSVSWRGARAYAQWLTEKTGKRYELPTAAQWEAGARGGGLAAWWWGAYFDSRRAVSGGAALADVGTLPPNGLGLYDTAGNAWEWVLDCFHLGSYRFTPRRDPVLLSESCFAPEVRGGSFRDGPEALRSGRRLNFQGFGPNDSVGFRLARQPQKLLPPVPAAVPLPAVSSAAVPGLELTLDVPAADIPTVFMLFLPGREVLYAEGGTTLRVPLPGDQKVTFSVKEADTSANVERTVTVLPDKPTKVRLTAKDFKLEKRGSKTVSGRVLLSDRTPVKGAVVVLSDYPDKRETITGEDGSYRFENARGKRQELFVDARNAPLNGDHSPLGFYQGVSGDLVLNPAMVGFDYLVPAVLVHDDDNNEWADIDAAYQRGVTSTIIVDRFPRNSRYSVFWEKEPLYLCTGGGQKAAGVQLVQMDCRSVASRNIRIRARNRAGAQVSVAVYAASTAMEPEPYELDTYADAWNIVANVNVDSFIAWVDEDDGCFSGEVQIPANNQVTIDLNDPWTCYGPDGARQAAVPVRKP